VEPGMVYETRRERRSTNPTASTREDEDEDDDKDEDDNDSRVVKWKESR